MPGPDFIGVAILLVNTGTLGAVLVAVFKGGRWIGRMEEWQRAQDGRLKAIEGKL